MSNDFLSVVVTRGYVDELSTKSELKCRKRMCRLQKNVGSIDVKSKIGQVMEMRESRKERTMNEVVY